VYNLLMSIFSAYMFWGSARVLLANWQSWFEHVCFFHSSSHSFSLSHIHPHPPTLTHPHSSTLTHTSEGGYSLRLVVCDDEMILRPGMGPWFYLFFLSKYIEYLDTVFLILNRKYEWRVGWYLQLYHHAITASVAWVAWHLPVPSFWVGLVTNTFVHIVMYAYYAVATWWPAVRKHGPVVTSLQLVQFIFCVTLGGAVVPVYMYVNDCRGSWVSWLYIEAVYTTFLLFFAWFAFDKASRTSPSSSSSKRASAKGSEGSGGGVENSGSGGGVDGAGPLPAKKDN
jgi:hypothetical protein